MEGSVVANDTDACIIKLPSRIHNAKLVAEFVAGVNARVSATYADTTNDGIPMTRLELAYEELIERMWVSAKKSYIQHQLKGDDMDKWVHHTERPADWKLSADIKSRGVVYTGTTKAGTIQLKAIVSRFMEQMQDPL